MSDHRVKLKPFTVPNFAVMEMPTTSRQEVFTEAHSFALSELEPETLADLCDDFRRRVFQKAEKADPNG